MTSSVRPPAAVRQIAERLAQIDRLHTGGRFAEAEAICHQLLALYPDTLEGLNFLAIILRDRGQFEEAQGVMAKALEQAPREPALHNNLGNILRAKKDFAGAREEYRRAIALKPDYAEAYHNLGTVLQAVKEDEPALAAFRRALGVKPGYLAARAEAGLQLSKLGRYGEALDMLRPALGANHFPAHYYTGLALGALNRFDEARAMLETAFRLNPQSAEAAFALGNMLSATKQDEMALRAYATAIALAPLYLDAHFAYNQLAWMMGREDLNYISYAAARQTVGDAPDLLLAEADQRLRLDDAQGAAALLKRARQTAPERTDVMNALARAFGQEKQFGDAAELLHQASVLEPDNIDYRRDLGIALLQDGQTREARRVLEETLRLSPFDQLTLAYLTLAYREAGDSLFERLFDAERLVRVYDLPPPAGFADAASFNGALAGELLDLHNRRNGPFDQTLRGGTQTIGHLFQQGGARVGGLRERIQEAVRDYIQALPDDGAHPLFARKSDDFFFSGAWSCRLRSSGYHTNHVHHEGWISSAYYVSLPEAVNDGHQGWLKFGESRLELGARDRPSRFEKPVIGKLVLFPSYYWHGTAPFMSEADRLAVAFDVLPGKRPA